jgi:leucyl aminopeptidase (aminopeptidase T)
MNNKAVNAIDNIFRTNLGVKKTERVLVFTDDYNSDTGRITKLVAQAGRKFAKDIEYIECRNTGCHGVEPPEEIWVGAFGDSVCAELRQKRLFSPLLAKKTTEQQIREIEKIVRAHKKESVNAVIALPYFSTTHTRFRDMLNRICGARYASMPLFDEQMLAGAMSVDWGKMAERTKAMAERVNKCENIEIETPNGTFIAFSKKGREAMTDTGIITGPGQFSNLPAGEVYLAPLEGTANGRLVLEWAPTRKLKSPITIHIEKGLVREVEGGEEYAAILKNKLAEREENRNIAELGIGTNDKASRPDNILESEKISGTIHIALGDNSSFGGKVRTSFHQDFVFFGPALKLLFKDGSEKILLKDGEIFSGQ